MTLKALFDQSVDFLTKNNLFYGHGVAQPEDEVLLLLMHVLQMEFAAFNNQPEFVVTAEQVEQTQKILEKRVSQRIPMAYLVGFSMFAGLKFQVDERVLIPRSPFVELIDLGFQPWIDFAQKTDVLDLCTGSGCIGLAIAHYFEHAQVDVSDISAEALELARCNMQSLELSKQVTVIESDLFEHITATYDLVVSNPPYVDADEYADLPREFEHEPQSALVSPAQGMEIPVKILYQAPDYLKDHGFLFLEVGYNDEVLERLFPEVIFEWIHFEMGGQGICVFNRDDLLKYRPQFKQFLQRNV